MNKNNKKKAFTLPEVIITLSVTVVVLSLITSLVIVVSNVSKSQIYAQNCQAEYQYANNLVNKFANAYSFGDYTFSLQQTEYECKIVVQKDSQTYELVYQKAQSKLSAQILDTMSGQAEQKVISFQNIKNIVFAKQDNLLKCEYQFESYPPFTNLIVLGVA